jgi:hypothetical protein
MSFAENLRDAMLWAGVSCPELARSVHSTTQAVYRWRGGAHVPHAEVIGEIADALGCTCDYLIRGRA